MPSLSAKDRVSLCQFSFADGRRCRTPRTAKNPHFCFDHAQKEARALAEESLSKDLAYFFSGDYLSACDLSTALGRLIPAVIRGDVKPRAARTIAYMAQTLLQTIHLAEHEYTNTFGSDGWRKSIRHSVNSNYNHRFPHAPKPAQPADKAPHVVAGLQTGEGQVPQPVAPSPHTPLPPTSDEFIQQVLASRPAGSLPATPHVQPAPPNPQPACPEQGRRAETPMKCHSERREEPAFSATSPTSAQAPQKPACPEQDRTVSPPQSRPSTPQRGPSRDTPWWNFGDSGNIPPDSHLL